MATWRCPHCRTVQADSARCFLCGRSATSCGTCTNFRRSVVGGVGYCGLDRRRVPLSGEERRDCWTAAVALSADGLFADLAEPAGSSQSVPPLRPLRVIG